MKNVLITGGSRGIGASIVELFSEKGYNVAFTYKSSEEKAQALSKRYSALSIKADLESESEILGAVRLATEKLGSIDVLINNAGVSQMGLITDLSLSEWNRIFSINSTAVFLFTKEVLPQMIKKKTGRIINISSMWGSVGASCEVAYSASKAAVIGFTRALAKEVGPSGITVNAITPGVIETDMISCLDKDTLNALSDETPLMRLGTPLDVARAALFLADGADFITGQVLGVNGGFVI